MMSRKKEYKSIMQKVIGRQNSTVGGGGGRSSSNPESRQRQRQMLQEIRQNISEVRFETNEAIEQMSSDMRRMSHRMSRSSEADDESTSTDPNAPPDYGATDTLRAMKQLILSQRATNNNNATSAGAGTSAKGNTITTKAECSTRRPSNDDLSPSCSNATSLTTLAACDDEIVEAR